jgi:hypothetical protein
MIEQQMEDRLRAWFAEEVGRVEAPPPLVAAVDRVPSTVAVPRLGWRGLFPLSRPLVLIVLTALTMIALIGSLVVGGALREQQRLPAVLPQPVATEETSPTPRQGPTAAVSDAPSPPIPTAEASPATVGEGPVLTWTKLVLDEASLELPDETTFGRSVTRVAWVGQRFVLIDQGAAAVSTSIDGLTWDPEEPDSPIRDYYAPMLRESIATWQHELVGWGPTQSSIVLARPPEEPARSDFEGKVGAFGIGSAGVVVRVHSTLDFDAYITSLMGPGWVESMDTFSYEGGILRITTDDDRVLEIDWADHGFQPGDLADRGFGWHSPDGDRWTPIRRFPPNVSDIVGVRDGFIASGEEMWHSADGLKWRRIGPLGAGPLLPWMGDVLMSVEAGRFDLWTSDGPRQLPMNADIAARSMDSTGTIGAGPLGIVSLRAVDHTVLYSPDGVEWSIAAMPDAMAEEVSGRPFGTVAVGGSSVVVLLWREATPEHYVPSLWLGTVEP